MPLNADAVDQIDRIEHIAFGDFVSLDQLDRASLQKNFTRGNGLAQLHRLG